MITQNKYRTLIWVIVVLVATNLSMGISFVYHKQQDKKLEQKTDTETVEVPAQQRTRFFREQLNLTSDQLNVFRDLNRNFNRSAREITDQLEALRIEMVNELGKPEPSESKLNEITDEIGKLHAQLKKITISYYIDMKAECNSEQKEKLNEIFKAILGQNEDVKLPGRQGGYGWGRNRSETD